MSGGARRGFCRVDLLGVFVISAVAISTAGVALDSPVLSKQTQKDAAQLRGIHQSFLVFANEFNGILPRPGLIDRLPYQGQEVPGRGEEDRSANTTANLYSAMLMQNYFTPELVVSPVERSPKVRVCADDEYNYEAYDVVKDVYWDSKFKADLAEGSHASYAHMPIWGKRAETEWRSTMNAHAAILGNRGPKDGAMDPASVTCGPHGNWAGHVVTNDNAWKFLTSTSMEIDGPDGKKQDSLFAMEQGLDGLDLILAFTRVITDKGPELQFD